MLVGICDFPSEYAFPPRGYGGIERWLWAVALGAREAGADVHLLGPQWRPELADDWRIEPVRLEDLALHDVQARAFAATGYDLLVVGHEYPSLPAWRATWESLETDVATFQHWPYFAHQADAFDGRRSRLYCYSAEMCHRYGSHAPISELAVHQELDEPGKPARDGDGLLWLGRIHPDKAPHLAVRSAQLLGRSITVAGPVFDEQYVNAHRDLFGADQVTMVGEVGGPAKVCLLAGASTLVYTCARDYIEAGAASFGEALRAGTPVAALAWRPGSCAEAALCSRTGHVANADPTADDDAAATALAAAIEHAAALTARDVQGVGMERFDPARHFRVLATRPC